MTATSGAMQLSGSPRHAGLIWEVGSSALDRRALVWSAPDPATIVLDLWRPPSTANRIADTSISPWPAPLPATRVEMSIPVVGELAIVEPLHAVQLPDLAALARKQARQRFISTRQHSTRAIPEASSFARATQLLPPASVAPIAPIALIDASRPGLPAPTLDRLVLSDDQARAISARPATDRSGVAAGLLVAVVAGIGIWSAVAAVVFALF
jgi:hypothetical protein